MMEEYSKSNKKPQKIENKKLMMKINTTKNVSGIGCVILFGGALITAAAVGSAFLISRKYKKSTKNVTKKEGNEKIEDESSNKGLHFILPDELQQPSSNETDKLCHSDSTTSLFSTPCLIQDGKPKLDGKRDTLNAIVSDHPKTPSFEILELSETKISLLPDTDQELDEVSRVRIDVIQGNEKIEVLSRGHQAHAAIFSNPDLQMDYKREILVDNDKGESNELQHTGVIETDNLEEDLIQEQEKQARGDQETNISNEHEPLNSAFELMKAADEEGKCADAETQINQIAKKCDERMQFSDEEECTKENDDANSCYEEATSENSPSIDVENLDAFAIRNDSIDDEHSAEAYEDEDKVHVQIMHFEEQCANAEAQIDQFAKKYDVRIQFSDEKEFANENDQVKSCYEEATSENSHCGTYIMDVQNLAASEIRNASVDNQHSAEVIKETNVMDPAARRKQSEAEHSPIQLVEKYSFEQNCQGNVLEEENEATKRVSMDIDVVEKDLEVHSKEMKDDIEESVFVYEEKEVEEDVDDNDNDADKDDDAQEVEDDILEGARHSSEHSNSDKIWPADSNQELLLEHKVENMKEEEKGTKIEEDELCIVENCNLESTQNDVAITSCQQSYDGKDDSTVNVIDNYRTKLMNLNDIAAITRRRSVLLGALLALIWYLVLKGILPCVIVRFKILNQ